MVGVLEHLGDRLMPREQHMAASGISSYHLVGGARWHLFEPVGLDRRGLTVRLTLLRAMVVFCAAKRLPISRMCHGFVRASTMKRDRAASHTAKMW
jgi:hypothetical protein